MPERVNGGVFNQQVITGSQRYFVIEGADFSGAFANGQPVAFSSAEIIFNLIGTTSYINIMNPYSNGISFALEINRSNWDADSLQVAIQSLGTDVGVDHVNCSVCTVIEVPFNFQYLAGGGGSTAFIDLTDVTVPSLPNGYVQWDPTGTVLEYTTTIPYSAIINVPPSVTKIIAGTNISISPTSGVGDVTINATAASDNYIPVPPGASLLQNKKYFVTSSGTVFLPNFLGLSIGDSVIVTKSPPNTSVVYVVSANGANSILTDIGDSDSIEIDATAESLFIYNGAAWALQIGSIQGI